MDKNFLNLIDSFKSITERTTAKIGEEYFQSIAKYLVETLDVQYALIGEIVFPEMNKIHTRAFWNGKNSLDNFVYDLKNTPCETVIGKKVCSYRKDVAQLFPKDIDLQDMKAKSYVGVPLFFSNKEPLGLLVIIDINEMSEEKTKLCESMISLFAGRTAAEIERTNIEKEREALIDDLEQKNNELEKFTYTVSHDLKSPLITIHGFMEIVKKKLKSTPEIDVDDEINRITAAVNKMNLMLEELLELSRVGRAANDFVKFKTHKIVSETIDLFFCNDKYTDIDIQIQKNLPEIYADKIRFQTIIQNLLDNAIKYSVEGVKPIIEIGCNPGEDENIFYVKDNGRGIKPGFYDKVFDLFFQLEPNSQGSGIGLSLVKRIVQIHDGRIWIEPNPDNHGTIFYFSIKTSNQKLVEAAIN